MEFIEKIEQSVNKTCDSMDNLGNAFDELTETANETTSIMKNARLKFEEVMRGE